MAKIQTLSVRNILGIKALDVELNGRHVYAVAGNGKNKTSFISAVFKVFTGRDMPPEMLHKGAEKGEVKIETDDFDLRFLVTEKQPKGVLTITDKTGAKFSKPREWLNGRVGVIDLSLQEFFAMSDAKRLAFIREICGLDLSDLDARHKEKFDERTLANKEVTRLDALSREKPYDPLLGVEPVEYGQLNEELRAAMVHNENYNKTLARKQEIEQQGTQLQNRKAQLEAELAQVNQQIGENANLQQQAKTWYESNKPIDMAEITARAQTIDQENAKIAQNKEAQALLVQLQQADARSKALTEELKGIDAERKQRIAANPLPVPGMTIAEGKLLLNGLPFEYNQINLAEQYIALLQLQQPLMKDIQIARMDFSVLDDENTQRVLEYAHAHGIQIFGELVDRSGGELTLQVVDESEENE